MNRVAVRAAALMLAFACWAVPVPALAAPAADNGAVVIMYHRFGDDRFPSTNIALEQFEAHIRELRKEKYTVLPLAEIVEKLRHDKPLPERAVGISIDDAYMSVYREAWPRLKEAGLPFTLFAATKPLDRGLGDYMSWDQLRELQRSELVTIGNHTHSHAHMADNSAESNREEVRASQQRFREELGRAPALFAYPYGEYSTEVRDIVKAAGFAAAFGQHSGAIAGTGDRFTLPRFALNEHYGGMERFRLAVNALPLPVADVTPRENVLGPDGNPPLYGFTVLDAVDSVDGLNCFASGQGRVEAKTIGKRVEVRLKEPLPNGRARVNCTMPGPDGRWRWFGRQFYVVGE
ncbi:chitin deacetylase [Ferruginivarius sediminum]|uniref:Chitooligosaccharide deacetylase n=2 Tax=Ferruginivarius sediminum TaxID=2661937 RepID=A0A369TEU1_9PROT|nr:chitin deacetylase [Ferruginivarius sediminum]